MLKAQEWFCRVGILWSDLLRGSLVSWVEASVFHEIAVRFPAVRLISLAQGGQKHWLLLAGIYPQQRQAKSLSPPTSRDAGALC